MKRKALGKGLSALLPEPEFGGIEPGTGNPVELPTDSLEPNPLQPRATLDSQRISELAASIRENGMVQPILVRPLGGGRHQIVAGERRWRAAQQLGLRMVPVLCREVPDERLLELALVENIQRQELTPLEEALAFQRLLDEFHLTQDEVGRRVGRDRTTVANTIRLLRLPREIRDFIQSGKIDAGHGRALLALDRAEDQTALARETARKGLSVREVERRVSQLRAPRSLTKAKPTDPNTRAAEERLRMALGTTVAIRRRGARGFLQLAFGSEAELNRLFEIILRAAKGR